MTDVAVEIDEKRFTGSEVVALRDLKFAVRSGEFIAIVGPSGAGKTTILNVVGGLDDIYEGTVQINDHTLRPGHHPVQVGYMFQEPRLMPWLNVEQNIELVLHDEASHDRVRPLLDQVGLEARGLDFPNRLSGGMQRRVALARAVVVRPDLLLMDEPFVSLDEPTAQRLREMLLTLWRDEHPTVLFVTHNLREGIALADRVLFLSHSPGKVIHELSVKLPRPRKLSDPSIDSVYQSLLADHPEILSGMLDTDQTDAEQRMKDREAM